MTCRCYGCGGEITGFLRFGWSFPVKLGPEPRHCRKVRATCAYDRSDPRVGNECVRGNDTLSADDPPISSHGMGSVVGQRDGAAVCKQTLSADKVVVDAGLSGCMTMVDRDGDVDGGRHASCQTILQWIFVNSWSLEVFGMPMTWVTQRCLSAPARVMTTSSPYSPCQDNLVEESEMVIVSKTSQCKISAHLHSFVICALV